MGKKYAEKKTTRATLLNKTPPKSKKYMVDQLKALLEGIKERKTDRSPPTEIEKALIIEEIPLPLPIKTPKKIILPHFITGKVPRETYPTTKKTKPSKTTEKKTKYT